ncbi:MAG: phosphoribosyl-ATP diphosphatase [Hyphomonadaceae bacterium]|nr:phosphoribosyl-ATP diphosphatase [Hyphomonadaceae bacterium]
MSALGAELDALARTIDERAGGDPTRSYTASLVAEGVQKCAKKLGEEAVEAALAAVSGDRDALAREAADVLFHLLVTLRAADVSPDAVAAVLVARRGVSGLEEKARR